MQEKLTALVIFLMLVIENDYIQYILSFVIALILYYTMKLYSYKDTFDYYTVKKIEGKEMKILSYNIMTCDDNIIFPFEKRFEKMKDVYFTGEHFAYCLQEVHESYIEPLKNHFESLGYMCFFEEYHGYKKMSYMTSIRMDKNVKILSSSMIYDIKTKKDFPRKFQSILIKLLSNKKIEIINVHFPLDNNPKSWEEGEYPERMESTNYIVKYLQNNNDVLIVGDFNILPAGDDNKERGGMYQLTELSPYLCKMPNTRTYFGFPFEKEDIQGLNRNLDKVCESNNMVKKIKILYNYYNDIFYTLNRYPEYKHNFMPLSDHFPLEIYLN